MAFLSTEGGSEEVNRLELRSSNTGRKEYLATLDRDLTVIYIIFNILTLFLSLEEFEE